MISDDDKTRILASIALGIPKERIEVVWTPEKSAMYDRAYAEMHRSSPRSKS